MSKERAAKVMQEIFSKGTYEGDLLGIKVTDIGAALDPQFERVSDTPRTDALIYRKNTIEMQRHELLDLALALERELAEAKKDAERYRWLRETLQSAKGGAYVTVNEHLSYYEKPEIGKEVKIQWYPITPIGFYIVEESTLDAAIDAAMKECGK